MSIVFTHVINSHVPLMIDVVPVASFFFGIGYFSRRWIMNFLTNKFGLSNLLICSIFVLCAFLEVALSYYSGMSNISFNRISSPLLFFTCCMLGIFCVIISSKLLNEFFPVLARIGRHSMSYFALEQYVLSAILSILSVLPFVGSKLTYPVFFCREGRHILLLLLVFILEVSMLLLIIPFIDRSIAKLRVLIFERRK